MLEVILTVLGAISVALVIWESIGLIRAAARPTPKQNSDPFTSLLATPEWRAWFDRHAVVEDEEDEMERARR